MIEAARAHVHVAARRVVAAAAVTVLAGGVELVASRLSGSLFLLADAVHLVAHLGIFVVLLLPTHGPRHAAREDAAACAVLSLVVAIGAGIAVTSVGELRHGTPAPPPGAMLVALLGLAANVIAAWLFRDPARRRWSFRAALAHELADASLTLAGLAGAAAIALFHARFVDPGLSLAVAAWLLGWAVRLLWRRARLGRATWQLLEGGTAPHWHAASPP